jgi:multidrug efflux pump subunit AcrA (membrane-fusion protein)
MQQLEREAQTETRPDGARSGSPAAPGDPLASDWTTPVAARRRRTWLIPLGLVVGVGLIAAVLLRLGAAGPGAAATPSPAPTAVPYDARGKVVPATQARLVSLQGGVVRSLRARPGTAVGDHEEIARVETATGGVEVIVAPFTGTLLSVPVQVGDGLLPGAPVAVVGDLTALRVETTDVDEYLIASLRVGQPVEVVVDALGANGRAASLPGRVAGITLLPQTAANGDQHYPVLVQLDRNDPALRPGMTARLRFARG